MNANTAIFFVAAVIASADVFAAERCGRASVQAEAAALNARLANWVYTVPAYKAEQLSHHLDDLLAPKAGPAAAGTRR